MRYFEELAVGQIFTSPRLRVDAAAIKQFAAEFLFTLADAAVAPLFDYLMRLPEAEAQMPPTSPLRFWWERDSVWSTRPRNGLFAMRLPSV